MIINYTSFTRCYIQKTSQRIIKSIISFSLIDNINDMQINHSGENYFMSSSNVTQRTLFRKKKLELELGRNLKVYILEFFSRKARNLKYDLRNIITEFQNNQ